MASLASVHAMRVAAASSARGPARASSVATASMAPPRRNGGVVALTRHRQLRTPRSSSSVGLVKRRTSSSYNTLVIRAAAEGEDAPAAETPVAEAEDEAPAPAAAAPAARANPDAARIAEIVPEIKDYLKLLYVKREMNFNEVRLTLAIEDPRLADRRERYGIEDESGVSADEKCAALEAIDAGETPTDLLACEKLLEDFRDWPGLEEDAAAAARRSSVRDGGGEGLI